MEILIYVSKCCIKSANFRNPLLCFKLEHILFFHETETSVIKC